MDHDEANTIPSHHPSVHGAALALVAECEAFLAGTFAERSTAAGRDVSAWVVLNRLAHATVYELRAIVAGLTSQPDWFESEQHLARHLLDLASTDADKVRRLQRSVLVPLELWLAGKGRTVDLTPDAALALADNSLVELAGS